MAKFRVGEVVQLPSGGCKMTVLKVTGENVDCVWIADDGRLQNAFFPETILLKSVTELDAGDRPVKRRPGTSHP
jgi:uncharacterized protein YodC (DUF2158 family)